MNGCCRLFPRDTSLRALSACRKKWKMLRTSPGIEGGFALIRSWERVMSRQQSKTGRSRIKRRRTGFLSIVKGIHYRMLPLLWEHLMWYRSYSTPLRLEWTRKMKMLRHRCTRRSKQGMQISFSFFLITVRMRPTELRRDHTSPLAVHDFREDSSLQIAKRMIKRGADVNAVMKPVVKEHSGGFPEKIQILH